MSTALASSKSVHAPDLSTSVSGAARSAAVLAGRFLFAAIFLMTGYNHLQPGPVAYAAQAGVPFPELLVPASGLLAFAGALSILTGYRAKIGAWLIVAFLVPVTFSLHAFWAVTDPGMQQMQMAMFMKNISMLGGALFIAQVGAGPLSFDAARRSAATR